MHLNVHALVLDLVFAVDARALPDSGDMSRMSNNVCHPSRPQLSFGERLSHAGRVRSPRGAVSAIVDALGRRVAQRWWSRHAPWYVGRAVESMGLTTYLDRSAFEVGRVADSTFLNGLLWLGAYETLERHAVGKYLPRSSPVVELGAAIGVVSCLVNRRLANPTLHVSVEANPALIPVLERNRDRNGCRFRIIHSALAYATDSVEFGVADDFTASSVGAVHSHSTVKVPAVSLERILSEAAFEHCTLLCDIEGSEGDLVRREPHILRDRVHTLILEVHPDHLGDLGVTELGVELQRLGFWPIWQRGNVWVLDKTRR